MKIFHYVSGGRTKGRTIVRLKEAEVSRALEGELTTKTQERKFHIFFSHHVDIIDRFPGSTVVSLKLSQLMTKITFF